MAQLDHPQRRESPRTPKFQTIEQLLRDEETSRWSTTTSRRGDQEEDHEQHYNQKKSVLTKVKEKAKKLKHSLSIKKKHSDHDDNATPSWGVGMEDNKDEEEDAEYLGAPMYESEFAPESYKATTRQHPRATPVIAEKHVLPAPTSEKETMARDNPPSPNKKPDQTKLDDEHSSPQKTITETVSQKLLTPAFETVTEKLGPAYNSIASKIQGLTATNSPTTEASHTNNNNNSSPLPSQISPPSAQKSAPNAEPGIWDKGVSVKDYLLNKFEPAEEDRALSQAISEAISSPRSAKKSCGSGNCTAERSVVDKVREAVASLLRNDQPRSPPSPSKPAVLTRSATKTSIPRHLPVSTNAREVEEEENVGRILQTN